MNQEEAMEMYAASTKKQKPKKEEAYTKAVPKKSTKENTDAK